MAQSEQLPEAGARLLPKTTGTMSSSPFHPSRRLRLWRKTVNFWPALALMMLFLCNATAEAYTFTSSSAACNGSGDGRCDAKNNVDSCFFDGGDCCENSCVDGPEFSCGVVAYVCLDPNDPQYDTDSVFDGLGELGSVAWIAVVIIIGCWLMVCKTFSTNLLERAQDPEAMFAPARTQPEANESKKKTTAVALAWGLLAIELVVNTVIFFKGEGRVSKQQTDPEYPLQEVCVEGGGSQTVAYANFYRVGVSLISQLVLWALGQGNELPERAFWKMLVACVSVATGETAWSYHFSHVNNWASLLMILLTVHMVWPLIVDVMALCALGSGNQILFFLILSIVVCCCNSTCTMAPGEGGLLHVVDAVLNGVLGTWANVAQSGFALGAVFAVLPTFEIAYSVAELFVVFSTVELQAPW